VPDWRRDAYPRELTLGRWAWEFLRRNWDYRRLWREVEETVGTPEAALALAPLDRRRLNEVYGGLCARAQAEFGIVGPHPLHAKEPPVWELSGAIVVRHLGQ
jgi:hypothetical protein